jgi:polysaccharide pyruvyl transferase WcaK-like protein
MPTAVLINDTRVDLHHGSTRVVEAIFSLARSNGMELAATAAAHVDWRLNPSFVEQFDRADLVIVNGEGTLHHGRPAGEPLLAAGAIARERSKPSALINFSWQDNDAEMEKALLNFDLVSVRESRSLERLRAVRPDCWLVPDLSLYGRAPVPVERAGIGFGDSVLESASLELMKACTVFGGSYIPIRFVPNDLAGKAAFARSFLSKRVILNLPALASAFRRASATFKNSIASPDELLAQLARLELLVTGRFHGATLALCASTPVLVTRSNTDKVEALIEDAGLEPWRVIEPEELDAELLDRASRWHGDEEPRRREYLRLAQSGAAALFRDIRDLV